MKNLRNGFALGLCALAAASGCIVIDDYDAGSTGPVNTPNPIGPVAKNADEAWPDKGTQPEPLTRDEIARGCAAHVVCAEGDGSTTVEERLLGLEFCVGGVPWSAERAIPMSGLFVPTANERAEVYIRCAIENEADCAAVRGCVTERAVDIYCQEDGCAVTSEEPYAVTCDGDVATLKRGAEEVKRDCTRALAKCDAASPTGCTDRHFTACDAANIGKADRCDGNIRLGCDGNNQVSYRDCERMGGVCGAAPDGSQDCVYPDIDAECDGHKLDTGGTGEPGTIKPAACDGINLSVCVNKGRVTVPAPAFCAPPSP
jgi:hypothetical protein